MEEVRHTTAKSWFEQLKASRGHELVAHDEPGRRYVGFIDHTDEKHHLINVGHLRDTAVAYLGPPVTELKGKESLLRNLIRTPEGRKQLVAGYC
jgi:hypothetical protein